MYVEYSARVFKNIDLTMLVILRRCIMYCIHIVVDALAFRVKTVYTVYIVYIYIDCGYVYIYIYIYIYIDFVG